MEKKGRAVRKSSLLAGESYDCSRVGQGCTQPTASPLGVVESTSLAGVSLWERERTPLGV